MKSSKRNKFVVGVLLLVTTSCSTSSFQMKQKGGAYEFRTSPDRVISECERVEKDDGTVLYALSAQILDDRKRVISMTHFLLLLEKTCNRSRNRVLDILKRGRQIYLAGRGSLEGLDKPDNFKHEFPHHGIFNGSDAVMDFFAIANEKGDCFSPLQGPGEKCIRYPFPLEEY